MSDKIQTPTMWGLGIRDDVQDEFINSVYEECDTRPVKTQEDLARSKAHNDLLEFTQYTFPTYKADLFHKHVCKALNEIVFDDDVKNLMLFAPPQHGKSELVSTRLPPFWLAHHPEMPVALVSYGASLAFRNSRNARSVFESPFYWHIFKNVQRDTMNWRMSDWHLREQKGYVMAAGVGGPITGHGFGLGIIDDPVENWAAAQSDALRERIWQWWIGTFKTRMWEDGKIVLMMTRWHEDDLAGRILRQEGRIEDGGKWKVISYAARALEDDILGREIGDALAPSRYSKKYLQELEVDLGSYVWSAEYQQMPTKPEGDYFKIGRIQIVDSVPAEVAEIMFPQATDRHPYPFPILTNVYKGTRFWDLAASEKKLLKQDPDATSGSLICVHEGHVYWLDNIHAFMAPEMVTDLVKQTAKIDGRGVKVRLEQEPGQSGKAQIGFYVRQLMGFDVEGILSSGSKQVRATPLAAQVNAGNVFMLRGAWNKSALNELAGFPHAAHDDIVDSGSGGFNHETSGVRRFHRASFKHL